MKLFKCAFLGIVAILFYGCGESGGEFDAINVGKMNVVYENGILKIAESSANSASRSDFLGSASARFVNEPTSSICSLASHNPKNSSAILEFTSCKNAESSDKIKSKKPLKSFCYFWLLPKVESPLPLNSNLPKIALPSQDKFADSAQKDFILFFFTSTCGVCKAQLPILEQLRTQGIKIYAILGDVPNISKASEFVRAHKISLPLFYESGARRFFTSAVGGVKGVPVMVIFKDGKIKEKFIGLTPKGTLLRVI